MRLALLLLAFGSLAAADPLACQPNAEQPMLPIFHIVSAKIDNDLLLTCV